MGLKRRYKELTGLFQFKLSFATALREVFRKKYRAADFKADALAGIVVGMVAMPLGMALAIAIGVAPQHGLYTVIIAGFIVAALGGSRTQVTGPTAAFVVILAPIVQQFGFSGLLIAGFLAGVMLVAMGILRMGRLMELIPHPVVTGFTSGIAVVIATIQLKDFFGLKLAHQPESYFGRISALWHAKGTWVPAEFAIAALTLATLLLWPRVNKKIPSPLIALAAAAVVAVLLKKIFPTLEIATIGSRFSGVIDGRPFHGIPAAAPALLLPWSFPTPDGRYFSLTLDTAQQLMSSAFAIAMLGAIESLLSAVVADGMVQTRHDPDAELVALGVGNMLCPFFGGIPATGTIARTATNIRFGGRSPVAAMTHAIFVLLAVLFLAPLVSCLPMASLAALLVLVAYNMSEVKHFVHIVKVAPLSDVLVLLICFSFTVIFDMVVGVTVGVLLAALLLMREIQDLTRVSIFEVGDQHPQLKGKLPDEVLLYEIAGPLFFGAAQRAVDEIGSAIDRVQVVIFDMGQVPAMDFSGLVALETAVRQLNAHNRFAILVGVRDQPKELIRRTGLVDDPEKCRICRNLEEAAELAKRRVTA